MTFFSLWIDNILEFIFVYRQKLLFMILANGFLCVDTFFVLR